MTSTAYCARCKQVVETTMRGGVMDRPQTDGGIVSDEIPSRAAVDRQRQARVDQLAPMWLHRGACSLEDAVRIRSAWDVGTRSELLWAADHMDEIAAEIQAHPLRFLGWRRAPHRAQYTQAVDGRRGK